MTQRPLRLISLLCLAEALGMASFATFPALLPTFMAEWRLSNTEAGWINSMFYAGYVGAVPVLVSLTDRVDPRRIYLLCMALMALATAAFALLAQGLASALALRSLAGMALAGTYMPGLKALSDLTQGRTLSRAVAFYTAFFGIGSSLSFYLAGRIAAWRDWHWAFALCALGPVLSWLLVAAVLPARAPGPAPRSGRPFAGFGRVLINPRVMGYVLAYAVHNFELFAWRAWIVSYLTFSWAARPGGGPIAPTSLAAIVTLLGLPASVLGNELAHWVGRRRHVVLVMLASAAVGVAVGFSGTQSAALVIVLWLVYGALAMADSSAVTGGTVGEAEPQLRGTTMAVHSCIGFSGSFLGPLAMGLVLDATGAGKTLASWGAAFSLVAGVSLLGALLLLTLTLRQRRAA